MWGVGWMDFEQLPCPVIPRKFLWFATSGDIKLLLIIVAKRLKMGVGVFDEQSAANPGVDPIQSEFERRNARRTGKARHRRKCVAENARAILRRSPTLFAHLEMARKLT